MDIERPDLARERRKKQLLYGGIGAVAIALAAVAIAALKPALPSVERGNAWIDQVKRGTLVRQVRGSGTLVPVEVNWIAAATDARVERIVVQPGSVVTPDTVVLELTDPAQVQRDLDARFQLIAAEADYASLKNRLESDQLDQQAAAATLKAEAEQARLRADADDEMARQGVLGELARRLSSKAAEELAGRHKVQQERLVINSKAIETQLAAQKAKVDALRTQYALQQNRTSALHVRAGIGGVLQQVSVEVGQRVAPGTSLAKVVQPGSLKAVVKIPETQARDVQLGQPALIDTHNGAVAGHVLRIDPAAQNGTVTVDIAPDQALPKGARPDLGIDATIELQRLANVLYVSKPVRAEEDAKGTVFRVDGATAQRVNVKFGRSSVTSIEIVEGLREGDHIIVSDTSSWDRHERIRLE
ncbi:MAG TPA: HlyD family efflux transporter periplasmic adaptor subunit [Thermoanaerobaculia bacterium]|nr:HlyD family efflux transporter periplasmic adaptor subunit [Thermoanaerobaculia bacterium]